MATYIDRHPAGPHQEADVVVVGARCAGAATAMLLARAGHDVVMVDRSRPSTDTNSTHSLVRGGVVQLARWGLLDDVVATGAPEIRSVSFHHAGEVTRRRVTDRAGVDFLLAPRRHVLDDLLAGAAEDAGAELVTGSSVTGVLRDGHRVVGVSTRDASGDRRHLRARLVVGADGVYSSTARYVGAATVERHDPAGAAFYTYVGGVPWDGFEFHVGDRSFAGVFPTHDGEACVWLIRPVAELAHVVAAGADRLEAWLLALDECAPGLADRVRAGSITAPLRGSVGLPNHRRRATGPGWALVGDAGYHRDPITGHGITDAFRDAELLARRTGQLLRGDLSETAALAAYQTERNDSLAPIFEITWQMAQFPPIDRFVELQKRLAVLIDDEATWLAERPLLPELREIAAPAA
jgi:2-polyprenyl-6-methoxyphenol hydroxylase-like FAD-dependent oxidoreductase